MYQVINAFRDLQDNEHLYRPGDTFPRKGKRVTKARISALASGNNATGYALIAEAQEEKAAETPKAVKVSAKETAKAAPKPTVRRKKAETGKAGAE